MIVSLSRKLFAACLVSIHVMVLGGANTVVADDTQRVGAWQAVKAGEAVVLMRHALAPGVGDPPGFEPGNCKTQRNLSDKGRAQARAIGDVLRANGIDEAQVLSSEWCRCLDTAELLGLGQPTPAEMLNSFFADRHNEPRQTTALNKALEHWVADKSETVVLVTHQVNITALTGQFVGSGDMLIVTMDADQPEVLARIRTD